MRLLALPIILTVAALAASGCGSDEDRPKVAHSGAGAKVLFCYGSGADDGEGQPCIVRFSDGATCVRSLESYHDTRVYSDCRGGRFDELGAPHESSNTPRTEEDL
jgi:hypothetical protein